MASFGFLSSILATSRLSSIVPKQGKTKLDLANLKVCSCAHITYQPDVMKKKRPGAIKSDMRINTGLMKVGCAFLA